MPIQLLIAKADGGVIEQLVILKDPSQYVR
ncbi:hypothetical protein Gogos_006685, partial [Gossypium gossypioides]|nr:hypothetical protein [Gossypium gossypioides]